MPLLLGRPNCIPISYELAVSKTGTTKRFPNAISAVIPISMCNCAKHNCQMSISSVVTIVSTEVQYTKHGQIAPSFRRGAHSFSLSLYTCVYRVTPVIPNIWKTFSGNISFPARSNCAYLTQSQLEFFNPTDKILYPSILNSARDKL